MDTLTNMTKEDPKDQILEFINMDKNNPYGNNNCELRSNKVKLEKNRVLAKPKYFFIKSPNTNVN